MSETKKYTAEIVSSEARGGGDQIDRSVGVIALKPPMVVYDNPLLQDIILGSDKEGVGIAPFATTEEATYFRATSARTEEWNDLQTIRGRIEEFANTPVPAGLQFPHDEPFSPVRG